jgi:hypothetical protein
VCCCETLMKQYITPLPFSSLEVHPDACDSQLDADFLPSQLDARRFRGLVAGKDYLARLPPTDIQTTTLCPAARRLPAARCLPLPAYNVKLVLVPLIPR